MTQPSKRTISLAVLTQVTGAALAVFMLPLAAHSLGASAFAFLGIAATVQAWVFVVDGCNLMTRLVARQVNECHGSSAELSGLFQTAELFYSRFTAGIFGLSLLIGMLIGTRAADQPELSRSTIGIAVVAIGAGAGSKLAGSFYRGCVIGLNEIERANGIALVGYLLRFPLPYMVSRYVPSVAVFLCIQWLSFAVEGLWLRRRFISQIDPGRSFLRGAAVAASTLQPHRQIITATFSLALLAVLSLQTDKVLLAAVLPLPELGAASLAIMLCAGLFVVATPVCQSHLPAMSQGSERAFVTMMIALIAGCSATLCTILATATPVAVILMPGDESGAERLAIALRFYGAGNCLAIVSSGIYLSYFVEGVVERYRRLMIGYLVTYIPAMLTAGIWLGLRGTGMAWLVGNALLLCLLAADRLRTRSSFRSVWLGLRIASLYCLLMGAAGYALDRELVDAGTSAAMQVALVAACNAIVAAVCVRRWRLSFA